MDTKTKRIIAISVAVILIATVGGWWAYQKYQNQPNTYSYGLEVIDERAGYEKTRDYLIGQLDGEVPPSAYNPFIPEHYKWIKITVHYKTYLNGTDMELTLNFSNIEYSSDFRTPWEYRSIPSHSDGNAIWWYLIPQPKYYPSGNPVPWEYVDLTWVGAHIFSTDTGDVYFPYYN